MRYIEPPKPFILYMIVDLDEIEVRNKIRSRDPKRAVSRDFLRSRERNVVKLIL